MIFAHCSKLEKRKKWKTLISFFEAIICQTDGLSSNSRVTEKIEELVNLVSFERDQLKFGKLKRRLACLHTALGSALKSSPFFSFFFLIQLPSYVSLLSGLKHWKPADEVFSSYPAATTVLKDYTAAAHWSKCEKKSFTKGLRQKMAWIFQPPMKQFLFGWFYFDSPTLLFWYSKIQNNKEIHSEIVSVELIQNMAHSFKYFIGLNNLILFFLLLWILKYQKSIVHSNEK